MKNNNMNINVILALIVTYLEKQIEYTELKLEHHKQWGADEECENAKLRSMHFPWNTSG